MAKSAESFFIEKVKEFVGNNPGLELLGPRRSREIMGYISNTGIAPPPDSFFELCSYLLNAVVVANDKTYRWDGIQCTRDVQLTYYKK
jgi:hypothetical protein